MSETTSIDTDTALALITSVLALLSVGTGVFLATRRRWLLAAVSIVAGIAAAIAAYIFAVSMTRLF